MICCHVIEKEIRAKQNVTEAGKCKGGILKERNRRRHRDTGWNPRRKTAQTDSGEWRKMEKRKGRKRDKAQQVLIGERPGGECQRYLLSQRGLRCEARPSRGPQRCEVIMGKRGGRQRHLEGGPRRERKIGTGRVNVAIKLAAGIMA